MTGLLVSVMAFFVIHSVLWLIRNGIEHRRGGRGSGGPAAGPPTSGGRES